MTIVLFFPVTPQTNAQEMNYSIVVLGGVIVLATVYYYFPKYGGVNWFRGPVNTFMQGTSLADSEKSLETGSREKDAE